MIGRRSGGVHQLLELGGIRARRLEPLRSDVLAIVNQGMHKAPRGLIDGPRRARPSVG